MPIDVAVARSAELIDAERCGEQVARDALAKLTEALGVIEIFLLIGSKVGTNDSEIEIDVVALR